MKIFILYCLITHYSAHVLINVWYHPLWQSSTSSSPALSCLAHTPRLNNYSRSKMCLGIEKLVFTNQEIFIWSSVWVRSWNRHEWRWLFSDFYHFVNENAEFCRRMNLLFLVRHWGIQYRPLFNLCQRVLYLYLSSRSCHLLS